MRISDWSSDVCSSDLGHAADVAVRDGVAYLSDIYAGLHVIDVSTPTSPAKVRLVDPLGPAHAVALRGDHAFVAADTLGLKVIDEIGRASCRERVCSDV